MFKILVPNLTASYCVTLVAAQKQSCIAKPGLEVFSSSFIFEGEGVKLSSHTTKSAAASTTIINLNLNKLNWGIKLYPKSMQISLRVQKSKELTWKNEADVELKNKKLAEKPPTYNS